MSRAASKNKLLPDASVRFIIAQMLKCHILFAGPDQLSGFPRPGLPTEHSQKVLENIAQARPLCDGLTGVLCCL